MMETNDLINTWEEGNKKLFSGTKISRSMIEKYLQPKVSKTSAVLVFNLVFYCVMQLVTIGIIIADIIGYSNNPVMLSAFIPMLIISIGFLVFGYFSFLKLREIRNYSENLVQLLNRKLSFLRTYYETWMVIISFSAMFLIFSFTTLAEYQDGYYRINNPLFFIAVFSGTWLFIYGTQKVSGYISTRALKVYLTDLQNNFLEGSRKIERQGKKFKWFLFILVALFTAIFIAGLLKSMNVF